MCREKFPHLIYTIGPREYGEFSPKFYCSEDPRYTEDITTSKTVLIDSNRTFHVSIANNCVERRQFVLHVSQVAKVDAS